MKTDEQRRRNAFAVRKYQAKRKGIPFTLTFAFVEDAPEFCPCCGIRMVRGGSVRTSPSLDRLLPERGYTKANVVWVCSRCNAIKNDATLEEIYRVADFFYEVFRQRGITCETAQRPLPSTPCKPYPAIHANLQDRGDDGGGGFHFPDNPNRKEE